MRASATKRLCIVTDELAGPDYNGGIGTACSGLATALAAAGFGVDVLYTRVAHGTVNCNFGSFQQHAEKFGRRGVRLLSIVHEGAWHEFAAKSHAVLNHLQTVPYDLVFFNDTHGTGFYPLLSRRTGNPRLASTKMFVVTHSATQWIIELNGEPVSGLDNIRLMEMERRSIELCDVAVSPSAYLLKKYQSFGWRMPAETQIRRYILPDSLRAGARPASAAHEIDELVFFGRLERRKGIDIFCSALDRVKYALQGKTVSFLGKDTQVNGLSTLEKVLARSAAWPFEVRVMPNYDRETALNYLRSGKRVAMMPSLEDNSPCVIQECLELGIPFVASSGSGGEELISADTREACCFPPTVAGISAKILQLLEKGATAGALSFDPEQSKEAFVDWISSYLGGADGRAQKSSFAPARKPRRAKPAITLVMAAPEGFEAKDAALRLKRIASEFPGGSEIVVLAGNGASPVDDGAARHLCSANYEAFCRGLDGGPDNLLCIWDAGLELNPDWLVRAKNFLAGTPDCAAVTGLVTTGIAPQPVHPPPHASLAACAAPLRQAIVGQSQALELLSLESNSGFVLMRRSAFLAACDHRPWADTYARLKPVDLWIDELVRELRRRALRVELIPDLAAVQNGHHAYFEVSLRGASRRSSLAARRARGSATALVSLLGIDKLANGEAKRDVTRYLDHLSSQTRLKASEWDSAGGVSNAHLDRVAVAAFATGQTQLAQETVTYLASLKAEQPYRFSTGVERFWQGLSDDLSLTVLFERSDCSLQRHKVPPRLCIEHGEKAFVLVANGVEDEGLGRITFEQDLEGFSHFTSAVRTLSDNGPSVRFHVAFAACNTSLRYRREFTAGGNAPLRFEFPLPEELKRRCYVSLFVESRGDEPVSQDATAFWINPRFTRSRPG